MSRKIYCDVDDCRHCFEGLCCCYELVMEVGIGYEKDEDESTEHARNRAICASMDLVSQKEKVR